MGVGGAPDPDRVEMVAAYTPDRLRDMVRTAYSHLRSRGERHPRLEETLPPGPAGEEERLEAAALAALAELALAGGGRGVEKAIDASEDRSRCRAATRRRSARRRAATSTATPWPPSTLSALRSTSTAITPCCASCSSCTTSATRRQARALGLDFEDLELVARDLLRGDEGLREAYASRFEHVLVDEFQDTNRLQNELLALLSRENLFRVGDENQSIYRFRNADVGVFREHWEEARAAGSAESITVNFRARGEILDAIDLAFVRTWGESFEPLREAPGRGARAPVEPCVDLLVVERARDAWKELNRDGDYFGEGLRGAPPWRAAEARLLAKRVEELTREGPWSYGDVVILFRATTAMGLFERALDERGIPVHVVGGRGYWGQQQVADLRPWLAALANPLDGLALYSVLASPLAGLSLDAVALIGLHAPRGGSLVGPARGRADREPPSRRRADRGGRAAGPARGRPREARHLRRALLRRAAHRRPGIARDADRPGRHAHRLRPPPARAAGRRPAHGERAQADADGARVRGRRGPRPARLHRRGRRA